MTSRRSAPPPGRAPAAPAGDGDGRRERWAGHREVRRAELIGAAIAAIERVGPAVAMDDIAAEAGVTKPVIYRYFADKADLYLAIGQQAAGELLTSVLSAMEAQTEPRAMLGAAIDAYLDQIERAPNLYRFVVSRPAPDRATATDVAHDYQSLIAAGVARAIGRSLREAGLDSGGAEVWAHGIVGHVRAAGDWWLERQSMARADLGDYLVTLLWGGIGSLHRQALAGTAGDLRLLPAGDERSRRRVLE